MSLAVMPNGVPVYVPDGNVLTEYFWDDAELSIIQGPIGSGTSTCSIMKIFRLACDQEPDFDGVRRTRWVISRNTYKQLSKTTIKTWLEWFPEDVWGDMIRAEPGYHTLNLDHPSGDDTRVEAEIEFLALEGPEKAEAELASREITGFFYNEGQFVELDTINELLSRCARYPSMKNGPGATWSGGMIDLNAPVEGHWIPYMRGDLAMPPDWSDEEKRLMSAPVHEVTGKPVWKFFIQPPALIEGSVDGKIVYEPNPAAENQKYLKKPYLNQIRGKKRSWIDRRILNKVGLNVSGKPVYPTYSEYDHARKDDIEAIQELPVVIGLDFGREPAAVFMQHVNGMWCALSELIGHNESAELFAPRVAKHMGIHYPGCEFNAQGDPRGADKGQNDETTAFGIFADHGIIVQPATTDNNVQMRRSTVEGVLGRRNGLKINSQCLVLRQGLAGGYHYRKIGVVGGQYSEKPVKNHFSHVVEAFENGLLGGGEGYAMITRNKHHVPKPSPVVRESIRRRA